jgi:hypothetical protein
LIFLGASFGTVSGRFAAYWSMRRDIAAIEGHIERGLRAAAAIEERTSHDRDAVLLGPKAGGKVPLIQDPTRA